uniref:ATP-dependent helicase n=1 Tax=Solanum tuberosum TaxID=4113 RepID=M0ZNS9_SOLTU
MDSGDVSLPRRRTRQQFLKYWVELIEKRNSLGRTGNPTQASTCSVNIGEDVSCGRKRDRVGENTDSADGKRKMGKSEDGSMVKVDNGRSNFSPGTCESITKPPFIHEISDDDGEEEGKENDVLIGEAAAGSAVNTGSCSVSWSNVGSVGLRSPMLNVADEVVSSTSSMCWTAEKSEEVAVTIASSESESEASSDEDNDDSEDKNYQVKESSSSSESDDVRRDTSKDDKESKDDDLSCPTEQEHHEEGNKESNGGELVPQLAVKGEKNNKGRSYLLRPRSLPKSKTKKLNHGNCSSPILLSESSSEEDCDVDESVQNVVQKDAVRKVRKTRKKILKDSEFLKFVVDSMINVDDHDKLTPLEEKEQKEQVPVKETLPLIFRFEDEDPLPPEKEEWEKGVDDLFVEMDMCILESRIGFTNPSDSPIQSEKISGCQMGNHQLVLDEQIGLLCKVCSHVHLESKYIFPPFAERTRGRHERKYFGESPSLLDVDGFKFYDSSAIHDAAIYGEGTVWDLVPLSAKTTMYPHQREGFEFMWKNIVGDMYLEKLKEPISGNRGGCIISHPPGTGKTRLTIVFLQAFLKQFPKCRPVIIAPSNLLLNWEAEFQKWEVDIPFHNLNSKDFSFQEDEATVNVFHCLSRAGKNNPHLIRMVKLRSWAKISPKFAADLEHKWAYLSSSIDKNVRALEELRDMIAPLVHKCSENVKKVSLPGIRDIVIHLKPTHLQKELLKRIPENPGSFYEQNMVSLISVHPSLVATRKEFVDLESQLKERGCRLDPDNGVKMKFVVELIRLCGGLKERVIIFSQLLDPLNLIKEQLNSLFGWTLGREILYMDGKLDVKQRQISINSLNDPKSDVKVLLASIKACSEGISLIGASRVVLLDVLWNPSVEQQAISRAYRNGQTRPRDSLYGWET